MKIRTEDYNLPFNSHKLYRVFVDEDDEIETLVTHDASIVESWIANIEHANRCRLGRLIVGLDVECRPNFRKGGHQPVATLQLSVGKYCLVFQILRSRRIPNELKEFLGDPNHTFVGVGVQNDVKMLWADYGLKVAKTRELGLWAAIELDRHELGKAGLKALTKEVLGVEMEKPKSITMSRWDKRELSLSQVGYACLDAYFSFEIGRRLSAWY
ncbi:werner syndrome-like exonuclease [Phtheirospermum japonicum]|uniref:Werner syndrome-like exonuclease n=1 Tax=Phtheirospermum japonicum TaxID=374723 RepID=A0A830C687_9LAMI|nr:werner syndrome-like exonuclease [Phtheirospermum japonicum]